MRTLILTILAVFVVFRVGFATQRIESAQVALDGEQCRLAGVADGSSTCGVEASLAGHLDGTWRVTPKNRPDRTFAVEKLSYAYQPDDAHFAWGAAYWLPALFLLVFAAIFHRELIACRRALIKRQEQPASSMSAK